MRKEFYEALIVNLRPIKATDSIINSFPKELLSQEDSGTVNITAKNYNLERGVSFRLAHPTLNHEKFLIKGPMGKGLGITKDSTGDFVAFAAGTGVLVFIDLVARLILKDLDAIPTETFAKGFRLHLYVSFHNKNDAIALRLLNDY